MNTRIAYGDYQRPETSILAGELSPAQIRRLELAGWTGDMRPLTDALGLARVGGRLYMERTIPTLEPATNARVDAQQFYATVMPLFARQVFAQWGGADKNFHETYPRLLDFIRGMKPDAPISTAVKPWSISGSHQEVAANMLRGIIGPYVMVSAITSPLEVVLPRKLAEIGINVPASYELNNDLSLVLLPAVWPLVTREAGVPPVLFNAMIPNAPTTPNEVKAALEHVQRFAATVSAQFNRR